MASKEFYLKGIKQGISIWFFKNGTIAFKINYLNNLKQGEFSGNYKSGQQYISGRFINDELTGEYTVLNQEGIKSYQAIYKNGMITTESVNKLKELEIIENKKCSTR